MLEVDSARLPLVQAQVRQVIRISARPQYLSVAGMQGRTIYGISKPNVREHRRTLRNRQHRQSKRGRCFPVQALVRHDESHGRLPAVFVDVGHFQATARLTPRRTGVRVDLAFRVLVHHGSSIPS